MSFVPALPLILTHRLSVRFLKASPTVYVADPWL